MPGVADIKTTVDAIKSQHLRDCAILPLHANLSNTEQKQVFAKINGRKIVVATNVAETSITIPEIVYVIDCGKVKETQYDPDTSMSKLVETYTR
jgi:ATP-dependent RNA helicase DHX57